MNAVRYRVYELMALSTGTSVAAVNSDEINRLADIVLIRMEEDEAGTTFIDVTLAAHDIHRLGPDYTDGLAANNSALGKHQFYQRSRQKSWYNPVFKRLRI